MQKNTTEKIIEANLRQEKMNTKLKNRGFFIGGNILLKLGCNPINSS